MPDWALEPTAGINRPIGEKGQEGPARVTPIIYPLWITVSPKLVPAQLMSERIPKGIFVVKSDFRSESFQLLDLFVHGKEKGPIFIRLEGLIHLFCFAHG